MPATSAMIDALRRIAVDPGQRIYALMDGARFDDLPGLLDSAGLSHRSLYRNVQDAELVRAGPWLIDPYRRPDPAVNAWGGLPPAGSDALVSENAVAADTDAALSESGADRDEGPLPADVSDSSDPQAQQSLVAELSGGLPAAVFWIGNAELTEAKLWRHLRTLNMVLIPKEYDAEDNKPPPGDDEDTHEAVMFRHGDGNVLAEVLPVLDASQFSRVFGPAKALMFLAPDHAASDDSTLRRALLPDDAPPAPAGMLKLGVDQYASLTEQRIWRNRKFTMDYLRDAAPEETSRMSDDELYLSVCRSEKSGFDLGLESDYAHGLWAFMLLVFGVGFVSQASIAGAIRDADDPDAAIEEIMEELAASAENEGAD
jgi:hypothetical protein